MVPFKNAAILQVKYNTFRSNDNNKRNRKRDSNIISWRDGYNYISLFTLEVRQPGGIATAVPGGGGA